jgi:hypothetical protein
MTGSLKTSLSSRWRGLPGPLALLFLTSCLRVPPQRVGTDRIEYGQVIADSWKRQTLLNVVRMRYADTPVFLEVASIINSYSVAGKATAGASFPKHTDPQVMDFGGENSWSNTPTVTYQPLMGDRFTKSLLQPIPPAAVFQLIQSGWPVGLVLQTVVGSINGLRNDSTRQGEDEGFRQLVETLARIQRAGALALRVESRKEGGAVLMVLRLEGSAALGEDGRLVRRLLGLDEASTEFEITYGLVPRNRREIAVASRSMLELLLQLGADVDLPATHAADGRASKGRRQTGDTPSAPFVHIHSGAAAPADTYAAVFYKGHWYWIDDTDFASKRVFTFLMILFSLAETGQSVTAPVVTVPSR